MSVRDWHYQVREADAIAEAHCRVCERQMWDDAEPVAYEYGENGEPGRCWDDRSFWECDRCDQWTDATPITGVAFRRDGSAMRSCQTCAIEEALEHV
jgi:hypothetical protein